MLRFHTEGVCLAVAVLLCVLMGCLRTGEHGAFDNESLRLLSVSGKHNAHLSKPGEHRLFHITAESATSLVEALRPIRSMKVGQLPPDAVDYVFGFQPGMDPVMFHVHLADGHLVYAERQYLYEGGDAKAFKRVADAIMAASPEAPGEKVDATTDNKKSDRSAVPVQCVSPARLDNREEGARFPAE